MKGKIIASTIILAALATAMLMGCGSTTGSTAGSGSNTATADNPVSVSVVTADRSNAYAISVNAAELSDKIYQCAYTYGTISLIRADGQPEEYLKTTIQEPTTEGLSESKLKSIAQGYQEEILSVFSTEGKAKYEEVDTLEAIRLAADSLKTVEEGDKYLVVADSGLSTTGYLNFCEKNLFHTSTEEIVAALAEEKAIPDLTGVSVVWLYAGQVAEPQERLSEVQKDKLVEIWTAVLKEAGAASWEFRTDAASSTVNTGLPSVSVVSADERTIAVEPLETMVLDAESVSFVGDKAVFTDQSQAEAAIREVAQTLLEHPENQVYIAGCTASAQGREAFCQQLSLDRAEAVESLLLACGVPESQMITVGLGDQAPWQKEDLDAAGRQIEEKASQNRCVVILDRTDPTYGDAVSKFVN